MVLLAALDIYVQFRVKLFNNTSDSNDVQWCFFFDSIKNITLRFNVGYFDI